jgi:hypothetical protein
MKLQITLFFYARIYFAQETTGILNIVDDKTTPFHLLQFRSYKKSTGIKYTTQSQADGYYEFNQLQPMMIMKRV